jgi:hypothetical protein
LRWSDEEEVLRLSTTILWADGLHMDEEYSSCAEARQEADRRHLTINAHNLIAARPPGAASVRGASAARRAAIRACTNIRSKR